ncbi:DUF4350 domain-containing protein [Methylomonas sp. AM2-LC]|uniref:DUF4350 domain-containing protein n=1 Tax=Methylomonas sp. AM2-LC TaxID=3153301 RepID=UPI0032633A13
MIKERLITLLTALAALGLVFYLFMPQHAESNLPLSLPSSEDRGADGLKGLFQWLQGQHINVISYRKPYTEFKHAAEFTDNGNLLIINLPSPKPISELEWKNLKTWVDKGNTVLILGAAYQHPAWAKMESCFSQIKNLFISFNWTVHNDNDKTDPKTTATKTNNTLKEQLAAFQESYTQLHPQDSQFSRASDHPLLHDINHIDSQVRLDLLSHPWTITTTDSDNLALELLKHHNADNTSTTTAWQLNAHAGRLVFMLTTDVFSNKHLNQADNAQLMLNILQHSLSSSGSVLFDDYHLGLSVIYDADHFFKDPRLHKTLAAIGLFWLFYLIGYSNRLAPVRPVALPLSAADFIQVTTEYFARHLHKRQLAAALVDHLLTDLYQHRRLHDENSLWRWLEQHNQINTQQLALLKKAHSNQAVSLLKLANTITYIRTVTL